MLILRIPRPGSSTQYYYWAALGLSFRRISASLLLCLTLKFKNILLILVAFGPNSQVQVILLPPPEVHRKIRTISGLTKDDTLHKSWLRDWEQEFWQKLREMDIHQTVPFLSNFQILADNQKFTILTEYMTSDWLSSSVWIKQNIWNRINVLNHSKICY